MTVEEVSYVAAKHLHDKVPDAPWSVIAWAALQFAKGNIGPGQAIELVQREMSDRVDRETA